MPRHNITLTILTWKAPKTLQSSLESLEPLFDTFSDRVLICQESDHREISIGKRFGFRIIELPENVGIQNGIKTCFESAQTELVLFLENDLQLRQEPIKAKRMLATASEYLNSSKCDFVKFRFLPERRTNCGARFDKFWKLSGRQIKRRFLGYLRFKRANWELSTSVKLMDEKSAYPKGFKRISDDFILSSTKYNKWENLGLFSTKTFMSKVFDFAESNPTTRSINGKPDLEHPLNCKANRYWLMGNEFKLLISTPGLFGHRRHDRSAEDEKWQMVDPLDEGGEVEIS